MSLAATIPLPADIGQVETGHGRVLLTRAGEPVAALVSVTDLQRLDELDAREDMALSRIAEDAMAQWESEGRPRGLSHADLLARYGITADAP